MGTSLNDIFGGGQPPKPKTIDEIFAEQDEQNRRQSAGVLRVLANKPDGTPEQAGEALTFSRRMGVPPAAAIRNLDALREMSSAAEFDADTFVRDNPVTSRWLTADPINAAVARDDFESLSKMERIFGRYEVTGFGIDERGRGTFPSITQVQRGTVQAAFGQAPETVMLARIYANTTAEQRRQPEVRAQIDALRARMPKMPDANNIVEESARYFAEGFVPSMGYIAGKAGTTAVGGAIAGGLAEVAASTLAGGPIAGVTVAGGMTIGAGLGAYNAAKEFSKMSQAMRLEDVRDENGNPLSDRTIDVMSEVYSVFGGALEVGGYGLVGRQVAKSIARVGAANLAERAATKAATNLLTQVTGRRVATEVAKTMAVGVAVETGEEVAAEFTAIGTEALARIAGNVQGGQFGPVENVVESLLTTAYQTALGSIWFGGLAGGAVGIGGMNRLRQAQEDAEVLTELSENAAMSKLRQRDPEKYAEVIAAQTPEGLEKVGIESERLVMLLQEASIPLAQFAEVAGITEQEVTEAIASGGDVYLPMPQVMSRLVGTPIFEGMKLDLKLRPDGMSQREADAMAKEVEAESAKIQEEMEAIVQNGTEDESGQRVIDELISQITAATEGQPKNKRFTEANIEQTARGIAAFYITQAQRTGVDAYELYASRGYSILGRQQGEGLYDAVQELRRLRTEGTPEQVKEAEAKVRQQGEMMAQAAFHGTPTSGIAQFDRLAPRGLASKPNRMDSVGSWFSLNAEDTKPFLAGWDWTRNQMVPASEGTLYQVELDYSNPKTYPTFQALMDDFNVAVGRDWKNMDRDTRGAEGIFPDGGNIFNAYLKAQGYDAIVVEQQGGIDQAVESQSYIAVLSPETQVTITHRNGEPVTAQERTDFLAQEGMQETLGDTIDVDGVSRPTTNSTGQPIHPTAEGVRNFWRWFGDSKVVDAEGRPLVVYHGTRRAGFSQFETPSYFSESAGESGMYSASEEHLQRSWTGLRTTDGPTSLAEVESGITFSDSYWWDVGSWYEVGGALFRSTGEMNSNGDPVLEMSERDTSVAYDWASGAYVDAPIPAMESPATYAVYVRIQNPARLSAMEGNDLAGVDNDRGLVNRPKVAKLRADGFDGVIAESDQGLAQNFIPLDPEQVKSALGNSGAFGPSADILMQTASVRSGVETLEEFGLDPKKTYTNREVATALERRQREKYGTIGREDRSPEAMKRIAEWMVAEVEFEMQNPEGSGIGWYSEKFQAALDALGQEFPEMVEGGALPNGDTLTRQGARDLVTAIVAITSDGADVQDNLKLAVGVYRNFRETGTFELQRGHQRESSFKGNLADITKMYRDYGADGMREVLLETKTIKELKVIAKARGMKFESDYQVTMRMPMSAVIFGEKLGAFYANLMGQANYLTMDRWWSRTFNRYRGTLLTVPTEAGLGRFKELLEADAKALAKSTKTPVPVIDEEQIVSAVIKYQQEYEERGFKTELAILVGKQQPSGKAAAEKWMAEAKVKAGKEFDSLYQLHELERAANTLSKAMFESLEDAPFSAKDRTFMIDTVAQARTFLEEKGFDVSPADLQAILWYYEKKLYGQLTRKKGKGTKGVSYADAARVALDATRPGGPADAGVSAGVADGRDVADGVAGEAAIFGDESEAVEAGNKPFRADILEQGTGRPNAFIIPGVGQQTIALMNGANLSSLLHEFSHDWLVILGEQAAKPDAPAQVRADYAELLKQLGVASTAEIGVEQQENFARMWERYYATAEAPSRALARVFTSFKRWMQKVYKDVREMFVPVSPEVARLFDRMIATDAELELARGANGSGAMLTEADGETLGATPDEMEGYAKAVLWRTAQEEARLIKAVVEDEGKETTEQYQAEAESVRAEVRAELEAQPVHRAFKFLREPDANGKSVKLNVEQFEAEHGKRPRGLQGIWSTAEKAPFAKKEGGDVVGTDAETMALAYGFRDGTAFIDALRAMEDLEVAVERRVREEMRTRFPDLTPFSQPLADEAQRVQHLADTDDVLVRELNLLAKSSGIRAPNVQAVKRAAKAIIAKLKVRDIRPIVYQNAEAKAARLAMEAFKAGDPEKAAFHKRQQLLNHILYREAVKQQERVGVIQRFAKRMMATPTQERMGKAGKVYQDALNSLLQSYDFRNIPLRNLDALEYDKQPRLNKTAALNAYKEAALEDALVVASIPASVSEQEGVVNYQQLSVMELDNVYSVMHQVYETASRKDKALRENEKRNLQEQADAFVESVTSLHTLSERPIDYYPLSLTNAKQKLAAVDAWHLPPEFLFVWLDGDTTGTAYTLFFKPFAEAEAEEFRRGEIAFKEMQRIEEMIELPSVLTDVSVQYEGIRSKMTKRSIIALALNMGTESGVRASLEAQVDGKPQFGSYDAILAMFAQTLTEADWKYITAKWDYANTFWPDIAELERQTNGIIPQKLEAAPFFVRTADGKDISVKGGYYPLSYASAKLGAGGAVKVLAQTVGLEEGVISPSGGARAQTMHGWTEERVKASGRPINLDLNVWNGHIVNVIHDLTHRKAVRDVYRLYKRKDVRQTIEQSAGQEAYNSLMPWLARIANPNQSFDNSFAENTIARARAGVTAVNMGLSVSVAMVQPLGYLQAADVIGPMWVAKGIAASFSPNFKSVAGAVLGAAAYGSTLGPAGTAIGGLFGAFVGGLDKASADVLERSVAMRQRREDFSRDARDYVKTRKNRLNGFEKFYFSFIGMMDNAVMVPVWIGAYRKAMAENGGNDGEAVQYADSVIRRSQGAGSPKDLSRVQGGPELRRMLTIHYSFMSRQYGLFRRTATNLAEGRMTKARVLASVAMIGVLSPILSELVAGRPPEDDEEWLPWAMIEAMRGAAGSIILLRDVARALGPKAFPYKISPVEDALKKTVGAIQTVGEQTVGQLFSDEDTDLTESELKEIVETVGYWTRTPTRAMWRVVTSFTDWMQGYDVESADFIRSRPR